MIPSTGVEPLVTLVYRSFQLSNLWILMLDWSKCGNLHCTTILRAIVIWVIFNWSLIKLVSLRTEFYLFQVCIRMVEVNNLVLSRWLLLKMYRIILSFSFHYLFMISFYAGWYHIFLSHLARIVWDIFFFLADRIYQVLRDNLHLIYLLNSWLIYHLLCLYLRQQIAILIRKTLLERMIIRELWLLNWFFWFNCVPHLV